LACYSGNLELVKYLLTSKDLKTHVNIHTNYLGSDDYSLLISCQYGHLEIVKYLTSSPDLKEHVNIHTNKDRPLFLAYEKGFLDIVKYFIFDLNIEKSEFIKNNLKKQPIEEIENWFELRELKQELQSELSSEDKKKIKASKI
jgi:hypothetical protein